MKEITIEQYKDLKPSKQLEYQSLNHLEPLDTFAGVKYDLQSLTWNDVKGISKTLQHFKDWNSASDIFESCFHIDKRVFWSASIVEFFAVKNFIIQEFTRINKNEANALGGDETEQMLWEQAGGKKLDWASSISPLLSLGELLGVYPFDLGKKPYLEIFALLRINKIRGIVYPEYDRLKIELKNIGK